MHSQIDPFQADDIALAGPEDTKPDGFERVSMFELRRRYGMFIGHDNLHMPMAQYMGMMLDIVRSMTSYKGVHLCKCPMDLWVFQEIIWERKPTVIIEIGNQVGGSAMFLADLVGPDGIVIGIDIDRDKLSPVAEAHPGIKWITGDANHPDILESVLNEITPKDRVMVIDDSSHEYGQTLSVLENYSHIVSKGQYFIVEDTVIGEFLPYGSPNAKAHKSVAEFMEGNEDFRIDRAREKWFITLNPNGYLEKIR